MQGRRKLDIVVTKEMLERDYIEFQSTSKVANKYGVSKKFILNKMGQFGIARFRRVVPLNKVRELASQGLSAIEIGKLLGFTNTAISKQGRLYGIPIKDKFHKGHILTQNGYIMIRQPKHPFADKKGYVREHRLVMEIHLGRYLNADEIVHHIDENKTDNRLDNLLLTDLPTHTKNHHIGKKGRGPDKKPRKKALRS